jgi:CDP-diacylglycerol---glycerol-3-phosphate 3-phosphatidyltransferase
MSAATTIPARRRRKTTAPVASTAAGCGHHGCLTEPTENILTLANAVTLARTAGCLTAVTLSISTGRPELLFAGLAIHCVGDMADGVVARRRNEETRAGAVLDIVSDRLCIAIYYLSYGHLQHDMLLPIALFLFQFMVLDAHLSLAFLNWPLRSLNYFYLVDRALYAWNWSTPGKALNSGALVLLMLTTTSPAACTALVVAITAVKLASLIRLHRMGVPAPVGCALASAS